MLSHWHNIATRWIPDLTKLGWSKELAEPQIPLIRPDLQTIWQADRSELPVFVQESTAAMKYLDL